MKDTLVDRREFVELKMVVCLLQSSSSLLPRLLESRRKGRETGNLDNNSSHFATNQQFLVPTKVIKVVVTNLVAAERRSQLAATRWRGRRGQLSSCGQEHDRGRGGDDDNYVFIQSKV